MPSSKPDLPTKLFAAVRFATTFFAARAPDNQHAAVWPGELETGAVGAQTFGKRLGLATVVHSSARSSASTRAPWMSVRRDCAASRSWRAACAATPG